MINIRNHFTLNAWTDYGNRSWWLLVLYPDWHKTETYYGLQVDDEYRITKEPVVMPGWFAVNVGVLGLCCCITFWPKGKE